MTLSCSEAEAHLVDVIDGRLESPLEMRVHAHLEGCLRCREKSDLWRTWVPAMRTLTPPTPAELNARHLQIEILRKLQTSDANNSLAQRPRPWWIAALGFGGVAVAAVTVVVVLALWTHGAPPGPDPGIEARRAVLVEAPFATLLRAQGAVSSSGRPVVVSAALPAEATIEVAADSEVVLRMDRGSMLTVWGPARLTLGGTPQHVALRLDEGTVQARVAHRSSGETFALATPDFGVEVRGTVFVVGTGTAPGGSWVSVQEGQVAVQFAEGAARLVAAGQTLRANQAVPVVGLTSLGDLPAGQASAHHGPNVPPACHAAARACKLAAREARDSMRRSDYERALRVVATAAGAGPPRDENRACLPQTGACDDELRYLRAEALRGAGRIDDAVVAYKSLNRLEAPRAMRQNALYAAAELEKRAGRTGDAHADYQRALAVAPRGALQEEALVGSMQTAEMLGDQAGAEVLARRYLAKFPTGYARAIARRLADRVPLR